MTNFNGIGPWANMLNYLNALKQNQLEGNGTLPQNAQDTHSENMQVLKNLSTNIFVKDNTSFLNSSGLNEAQQANLQDVLKMNNEVVQKYLQNLLEMPETLDKLLQNADTKQIGKEGYNFLKIFVENMLSNKELSELLNQNSSTAIQKLLNVISQSLKHGANETVQLKEILAVLNTIHSASSTNANTLRELFLLYIPINYQIFNEDSDFSKITGDNEESIKNSQLSIMFETYNYSNILLTLNQDSNIILIEVHAGNDFPFERFKKVVMAASGDIGINVLCDFIKIKDCGQKGHKQNFKIISNNFVPISVLNVSHIAIKTIFKLDYSTEGTEA